MSQRSKLEVCLSRAIILTSLCGVAGCAGRPSDHVSEEPMRADVGGVQLQLVLGSEVVIDRISYIVRGPAAFMRSGTIEVGGSGTTFAATIREIPAGPDYSLQLSSSAEGDAEFECGGSASFDIVASATTLVSVVLQCGTQEQTGTVLINGRFNICPRLSSNTVTPTTQKVGNSAELSAVARDTDAFPAPLHYAWMSSSGTLVNGSTAAATLICTTAGAATIILNIDDGDCTIHSFPVTVNCQAADGGTVPRPDAGEHEHETETDAGEPAMEDSGVPPAEDGGEADAGDGHAGMPADAGSAADTGSGPEIDAGSGGADAGSSAQDAATDNGANSCP